MRPRLCRVELCSPACYTLTLHGLCMANGHELVRVHPQPPPGGAIALRWNNSHPPRGESPCQPKNEYFCVYPSVRETAEPLWIQRFRVRTSDGIRTRVSALRGPRPRPLDNGGICAGELGFEPRQYESESQVLPLHHSPLHLAVFVTARAIIANFHTLVKHFFKFFCQSWAQVTFPPSPGF